MTEPTDAELDAVLYKHWPAFSMQATLVRMWVRAAMRAAIVKWGTPPAEQQAMESVLVDGAASQPPISNTLWRMLTGGYEHTYILQLPNDSRDRRELIDRACHNWRRICAEIGNSAVASAVSPQTAQAPQQAAPKAAPGDQRKAFESWARRQSWIKDCGKAPDGDAYGHWDTQKAWLAWAAALAAPQQEAIGLVESAVTRAGGFHVRLAPGAQMPAPGTKLYTAPQPAPAPLSDDVVKDAARWRWLSEHIGAAWNEGKFTSLVRIVSDKNRAALNASIDRMMTGDWSDAALAAQGGK